MKPVDLIRSFLPHTDLGPVGQMLIEKIIGGSDKGDDFEDAIKLDPFFTEKIITLSSKNMKGSIVKNLSHGAVLLGPENIRNLIFGHTLNRLSTQDADQKFQSLEETSKALFYSIRAEEHSKKTGNEYQGFAFSAGLVFDFFRNWAASDSSLGEEALALTDRIYKHGSRAAAISWALVNHPRISIAHRRLSYNSALLHDVGKLVLAFYDFKNYRQVLTRAQEAQKKDPSDDVYDMEIESELFGFNHTEVGAFFLRALQFPHEIETFVDYHHNFLLLKKRNPDFFLLALVINIADRISFLMETAKQLTANDISPIIQNYKAHFPLNAADILTTVLSTKSKGLLSQ